MNDIDTLIERLENEETSKYAKLFDEVAAALKALKAERDALKIESAQDASAVEDLADKLVAAKEARDHYLAFVERMTRQKAEPYFAKEAKAVIAQFGGRNGL